MVLFIPDRLSSYRHLPARRKSLCNPLQNNQSWVPAWKEWIQTGRDGWSIGRATLTNVWHHLTYWMAFLCQDTERVGGREAACFRLRSEQTRSLCRHTPPHTSLNCARKQINKPRLTSHTLHQVEKLTNHKMFFENKEKLEWLNLQNNVDDCKGCSLGLLQRAMEHAEIPVKLLCLLWRALSTKQSPQVQLQRLQRCAYEPRRKDVTSEMTSQITLMQMRRAQLKTNKKKRKTLPSQCFCVCFSWKSFPLPYFDHAPPERTLLTIN